MNTFQRDRRLREIIEDRCSFYDDLDEVVGPHDEMILWDEDVDRRDDSFDDEGANESPFFTG